MKDITTTWHEQTLTLLTDRAVYWHDQSALLLADPHFGKAAAFRRAGVAVPSGTTDRMLDRITSLLQKTNALQLIILGDLLHARQSRNDMMFDALRRWRRVHEAIKVTVVRGNHDVAAGDPPGNLRFELRNEPWVVREIAMCHHPARSSGTLKASVAGHIHPRVLIRTKTGGSLGCRCFVLGSQQAILPAFGDFTGGKRYVPLVDDRIFAIGPEAVLEIRSSGSTTLRAGVERH